MSLSTTVNHCQPLSTSKSRVTTCLHCQPLSTTRYSKVDRVDRVDRVDSQGSASPQQAPLPSYPPIPAPLLRAARVRRGARGGDVEGVLPLPLPLSLPLPLPLSLTCARLEAVEMAGQRWAAEALRPAPAVQGLVG